MEGNKEEKGIARPGEGGEKKGVSSRKGGAIMSEYRLERGKGKEEGEKVSYGFNRGRKTQ